MSHKVDSPGSEPVIDDAEVNVYLKLHPNPLCDISRVVPNPPLHGN